ncbi:N-acetyltransferase 8-like 2 [Nelusetta ayraudi]|uniref:N-acetyltransferase 8-like 2 n=1 Tax=Nelusetta ayraudi TaxID=303726 RepID=UPI003F72C4F0
MQPVIRKYRPQDKEAVCSLFITGILEHIYPCFHNSVSSPLHLLVTVVLCAAGYLLGSVPGALVLPGVWIALIYYSCHNIYSGYVQLKLRTDMKDISGNYLSRPDDCFWVAETQVDGRPQIIGTMAIKIKQSGEVRQAELFRMIISSSCRRLGIGVRMVKAAIDFCKERGISELVLETTSTQVAAVNLYKKMGFSIICTHTEIYGTFWVVKLANIRFVKMKLCL